MVSGVGPSSTLKNLNIPVVSASEGVGQGMWVCEDTTVDSNLLMELTKYEGPTVLQCGLQG